MNPPNTLRTIVTAAVVGLAPLLVVIGWFVDVKSWIDWSGKVLGYAATALAFVAWRHPTVMLTWERLKRRVRNADCHWDFTARYTLRDEERALDCFAAAVEKLGSGSGATVMTRATSEAALSISGVPVKVRLVASSGTLVDDSAVQLVVDVPNSVTSYSNLRHVFEDRLARVLEDVHRIALPVDEKYELSFKFPEDSNPFFGAMVQRLRPEGPFRWNYSRSTETRGVVQVTRNTLELVTGSVAELQSYFKQLVGLSLAGPARR